MGAPDSTVVFGDTEDLEHFIALCVGEGHTRKAVLTEYEHFVRGLDGSTACLNFCTWTVNHGNAGDSENMKLSIGDGMVIGTASQDIAVGDEIYLDYHDFQIPE